MWLVQHLHYHHHSHSVKTVWRRWQQHFHCHWNRHDINEDAVDNYQKKKKQKKPKATTKKTIYTRHYGRQWQCLRILQQGYNFFVISFLLLHQKKKKKENFSKHFYHQQQAHPFEYSCIAFAALGITLLFLGLIFIKKKLLSVSFIKRWKTTTLS